LKNLKSFERVLGAFIMGSTELSEMVGCASDLGFQVDNKRRHLTLREVKTVVTTANESAMCRGIR
jgi:hypothetical protein